MAQFSSPLMYISMICVQSRGSSRAYDPDTPVTSQRRGETNHLYRPEERREPPARRARANDVQV